MDEVPPRRLLTLSLNTDPHTASSSFTMTPPAQEYDAPPLSGSVYWSDPFAPVASTGKSISERVETWFYQPLENMGYQEGFLILIILMPIYERFLRHKFSYEGNVSGGSPIVTEIERDFSVSSAQALQFWGIIRNGLLHRAAPKEGGTLSAIALFRSGQPLAVDARGQFRINPFAMRDQLLIQFRAEPSFWSDPSTYSLPDEMA